MSSLVSRESLLRKLIFPRFIIPTAATLTAAMTFAVNMIVVAGFVALNQLVPQLDWLLVIPLLLELYIFVLGIALILSTLFVRFRDIGQIWELVPSSCSSMRRRSSTPSAICRPGPATSLSSTPSPRFFRASGP